MRLARCHTGLALAGKVLGAVLYSRPTPIRQLAKKLGMSVSLTDRALHEIQLYLDLVAQVHIPRPPRKESSGNYPLYGWIRTLPSKEGNAFIWGCEYVAVDTNLSTGEQPDAETRVIRGRSKSHEQDC